MSSSSKATANPQQPNFQEIALMVGQVFKPNTPVSEKDLFSGRTEQIRRIIDVIFQEGQHAIIFGERGVGKTSLANVLSSFVSPTAKLVATRVNSDKQDTFESVWRKIFDEMHLTKGRLEVGYKGSLQQQNVSSKHFFPPGNISPNDVRNALMQLSGVFLPVIIVDEFDRLNEDVRRLFADLIKSLSDYSLSSTIVLIGVGESVTELIKEHQSVSRALVQVQMPRMNRDEINGIILNGLTRLEMEISDEALRQVFLLSKGLPHYAHLIGLHATRNALDNSSLKISYPNLEQAIKKSINDSQQSIKTDYYKAIRSAYKDNLFADVLLSCALTPVNEFGEFAAQDLRVPMCKITNRNYNIPHYAQHLKEFSESKRGEILTRSGEKRSYRYKFTDPLMQPFVIMQGIITNKITFQNLV